MKLPIFQVDAFTSRRFGGNPAAVVMLEGDWPAADLLQAIAAENNLSETAFVRLRERPLGLRWFTPAIEVDLCGHATLASAHVLLRHYFPSETSVTFSTRGGELRVSRAGRLLAMDFPARPAKPIEVSGELTAALGTRPREAYVARDLLAIFESEAEIRALRPRMDLVAALDTFAVIASAPGDQVDFVSRFFAPQAGVPEDPVTGSAHCTLIPFWAARLGRNTLAARQVSSRGGELHCELHRDRVVIAGEVAEYLRGEIEV